MKLLILAEKPSAARNFAKALGGMTGNFNGNSYEIVHSHGHLLKLKDPDKEVTKDKEARYKEWNRFDVFPWNVEDFHWVKEPIDNDARKLIKQIGAAAQDKDAVVIATDPDPSGEGDLLAWEIIRTIHWQKAVYRMFFKSEEPADVRKALANLRDVTDFSRDHGEYLEALARERFDYSSMQLSRIATLITRQAGFNPKVIRIGRFKSALVMLVYRQQHKLKNYVKRPFFEVRYKDGHDNVFSRKFTENSEFRFDEKAQAEQDLQQYDFDSVAIDSSIEKKQQPPKLINLMDLATLLAKQGFSTKQVKDVYQKMYEESYVSYPRTTDTKIVQDDFNELLRICDQIADVVGIDKHLLTHRQARPKFITAHEDHGANRPGSHVPANLSEIEEKFGACGVAIYKQLAKATLAMFCEDYVYKQTKAHLTNHPEFKATVNEPLHLNYKLVFDEKALSDNQETGSENDQGFTTNASPYIYQGTNPKPEKPTLRFLSKYLEKHNIGTGATRLTTIADISQSKSPTALLSVHKGVYDLTFNGLASALLTQDCYISHPKVTKQLLEYMDQVKYFKLDTNRVPQMMTAIVQHDMPIMRKNDQLLKASPELKNLATNLPHKGQAKPKCSGVYQPTGEQISFNEVFATHTFTDSEKQKLLAGEVIKVPGKSTSGYKFMATGKLTSETGKNGHVYWGFKALNFEFPADSEHFVGLYKNKRVRFKNHFGDHKFTKQELQQLLNGNTINISYTTKYGQRATTNGKLDNFEWKGKKYFGFVPDRSTDKFGHSAKIEGIYQPTGEHISFNKVWSSHTFTKDEAQQLLAGKVIRVEATSKKDKKFKASGSLGKYSSYGKEKWGFQPDFAKK